MFDERTKSLSLQSSIIKQLTERKKSWQKEVVQQEQVVQVIPEQLGGGNSSARLTALERRNISAVNSYLERTLGYSTDAKVIAKADGGDYFITQRTMGGRPYYEMYEGTGYNIGRLSGTGTNSLDEIRKFQGRSWKNVKK